MSVDLRPYQVEAVESILDYAVSHPKGRLLLTVPPGGGKTVISASTLSIMAADQGMRALVVAHRREIVIQQYEHLLKCGIPESQLGIIMSDDKRVNPDALIQVASVGTLNRRTRPEADVVHTDEAHRDASDGRRKLRALYPDAFRLGTTGTPCRLDRRGLRQDYDELLSISSPSELILGGWLSAPKVYTVPPDQLPDIRGVRTLAGDFETDGLEQAVNKRTLIGDIVDHWKRRAEGRRTVCFAVSIEHSRAIVERFQSAGIVAYHLDQSTPMKVRDFILEKFVAGTIQVVSCVNILTEGWDCPPCKCVIMARPTKSLALHLQQTGRCMRPWEGVVPIILDHAGNTLRQRHGLPQMDREWSLDDHTGEAASDGPGPGKMCPACGSVIPLGCITCPDCKADFPRVDVIEEEGELVEHRETVNDKQKRAEMERILAFSRRKGFSDEWAAKVYEAKYMEDAPALDSLARSA